MIVNVIWLRARPGYRLQLTFSDGTSGEAAMEPMIRSFGPFAPLLDEAIFLQASVEEGAVTWPNGLDVATERLYALAHGLPEPDTFEQAKANELTMKARAEVSGEEGQPDESGPSIEGSRPLGRNPHVNRPMYSMHLLRKALGIAREKVAETSGLSEAEMSKLESNDRLDDVRVSTLRRYAKALDGEVHLVVVFGDRRYVLTG